MPLTRQVEIPMEQGYDIGIGVNEASGEALTRSISTAATGVDGAPGGFSSFQIIQVSTSSELEDELEISVDAKASIGLFKASNRFKFAQKCKINSYSLTMVVKAKRLLGFIQIDEPILNEAASSEVQNPERFQERFGDCFVRGLNRGGIFYGVIRVDATTMEKKTAIQNSFSGSIGTFSADAVVRFSETLKTTETRAEVFVYCEGGSIGPVQPQTPEQLLSAISFWSNSIPAEAFPYSVVLAPYSMVGGPRPPNEIDLVHQQDILTRCARLRSETNGNLNTVDYVILHINDFVEVDPTLLGTLRAGFATDLDVIAEAASFALENPKDAVEPETFARTKMGLMGYSLTVLPAIMPRLKNAPVLITVRPQLGAEWIGGNSSRTFPSQEVQGLITGVSDGEMTFDLPVGKQIKNTSIVFSCNIPVFDQFPVELGLRFTWFKHRRLSETWDSISANEVILPQGEAIVEAALDSDEDISPIVLPDHEYSLQILFFVRMNPVDITPEVPMGVIKIERIQIVLISI